MVVQRARDSFPLELGKCDMNACQMYQRKDSALKLHVVTRTNPIKSFYT